MPEVIDSFSRSGSYGFLSNFWPSEIQYEGCCYPTLEHAYAAAKVPQGAGWDPTRIAIAAAHTPGEAKRLGRSISLRDGWDTYLRYSVMMELLSIKFSFGSDLGRCLSETGDAVLIEGNHWHDQVWGDCRCGQGPCLKPGMNLLGWMLMRQRDRLSVPSF